VVVSGQFLLDSESRLREATLKMLNPGMVNTRDIMSSTMAVMNGQHEMPSDRGVSDVRQSTTSFSKYVCPMPSHAGILYDEPGICPLCQMELVPAQPWNVEDSPVVYYTCPMPKHYEIHEEKPGKCPLCGMTLIPITKEEADRYKKIESNKMPVTLYTCPMSEHADVVSDQPGDCPKCGMELVPTTSVLHGKQADEFWNEKHRSSETIPSATNSVDKTVLYTCPMPSDAEVVSSTPGTCPKCGMALVPTTSVDHGKQAEEIWRDK
ncbi:MAG: heavy metal-binding domain-containing protein, partial [Candidatus Hinthialibacter sp.]